MNKQYNLSDLELAIENAFKSVGHLYVVFSDVEGELSPSPTHELDQLKEIDEFITYLYEVYVEGL